MSTFIDHTMNRAAEEEEKILLKVVKEVLGRDPEPGDHADFQKVSHISWINKYDFAYKGIRLGTVTREFITTPDLQYKYIVTFKP